MAYTKENLGTVVQFLLPSLKLRDRSRGGADLEEGLHQFLLEEFGGYTATGGNVFGYWKTPSGHEFYGEHLQYQVSLLDPSNLEKLESFLGELAAKLGEKSLYLSAGDRSWLLSLE